MKITKEYNDYKYRIGIIYPPDGALDYEFWNFAPSIASLHFTRTKLIEGPISLGLVEKMSEDRDIDFGAETFQPIKPDVVAYACTSASFCLGIKGEKISFKTIQVSHGRTNSVVYIFNKLAYISDSNDLSIIRLNVLKNLNYLILDCLKFKKHPTHFSLNEAIFIHNKLKPNKTILTNLHHDLDYDYLLRKLPKNVLPAYDGLSLKL